MNFILEYVYALEYNIPSVMEGRMYINLKPPTFEVERPLAHKNAYALEWLQENVYFIEFNSSNNNNIPRGVCGGWCVCKP